jgi:hypothetical protein
MRVEIPTYQVIAAFQVLEIRRGGSTVAQFTFCLN